jgi:hypothetical protein
LRLFSFANEEIAMLQCYVLTCGRSVTAFLASPRSERLGQGPRSPHPQAGPVHCYDICNSTDILQIMILSYIINNY